MTDDEVKTKKQMGSILCGMCLIFSVNRKAYKTRKLTRCLCPKKSSCIVGIFRKAKTLQHAAIINGQF